jgi:hypothetical protein
VHVVKDGNKGALGFNLCQKAAILD